MRTQLVDGLLADLLQDVRFLLVFMYTRKNLTCCNKFVNKLFSHCLSQVVNKFGLLSDLLQGCSNKSDTVMI